MELSDEKLKAAEDYASLAFTPTEIAILLEVDALKFIDSLKKTDSKLHKAYYRGFLLTQSKIRSTQLSFALKGNQTCIDRFESLIAKVNKIL